MKTISRVSAGTWIRLVLLLAVLVNNALTVFGVNPVPGDGAAWETAVTVTTALAALTAYLKNFLLKMQKDRLIEYGMQ